MSLPLNILGTVFNYPSSGEDRGSWGDESSLWAQAVTNMLALLVGPNDILQTSFLVDNNQLISTVIRGLYFNPSQVRASNITYSVYRTTDTTSVIETGDLLITYNPASAVGQKFQIAQRANGVSGLLFNVDDTGQFTYTTSNITGTNYTGILKFTARSLST